MMDAFETAALAALLAGDHPALRILEAQLAVGSVRNRESVESGRLIDFWVEDSAPALEVEHRFTIDDVEGRVEGCEHELTFLLHIVRGRIKTLEIFALGGELPADPALAETWYVAPNPADAGQLQRVPQRLLSYALRGLETQDPDEE